MPIRLLITFTLLVYCTSVFGQLVIDNTYTPQQMVEDVLVGTGVSVSNVTFTGDVQAAGYFDGSATNIGLNSGVLLASGYTDVAIGPNNNTGASSPIFGTGEPGDADLDNILGNVSSFDATVLEFDFIPLSDTIRFRYVFGSEEYPEFVCSDYNDIFAFLLSGGTTINYPAPGTNLAVIPGTVNTSVTINNVNGGAPGASGNCDVAPNCGLFLPCCTPTDCDLSYAQYYVDNTNGATIQFDGFTVVLEAVAEVTPCETYHIKLAIADAGDGVLDSGVFLEANSFTTGILDIDVATANADSTVVESCGDVATVSFSFDDPVASNYTIPYTILGTATNGVDYTTITGNATIPAGQTTVDLIIDPIDDGITEGTETVLIEVQSSVCSLDTVTVFIREEILLTAPNVYCDNVTLNSITFGWDPVPGATGYEVSLDGGLTWIAPNPGPMTHQITGLNQGDTRDILVRALGGTLFCNTNPFNGISCVTSNCVIAATAASTDVSCNGFADGTATANPTGGSGTYTYIWDATTGNQSSQTASNLPAGTYSVTIDDGASCVTTVTATVSEPSQLSTTNISGVDASCGGNNDGSATISASGGTPNYSYNWSPAGGNTATINNLAPGNYTCIVTDMNGCTTSAMVTISGSSALTTTLSNTALACNGDSNGTLDLEVSGGTLPYSYQWDNGAGNNQDPTGLSANTYTVSITDGNNCLTIASAQVTEPTALSASVPNVALACNGGQGSLDLTVGGGIGPYTFDWNNGLTNAEDPNNLPAGNYSVLITDNNGCTSTAAATISEPTSLTATVANSAVLCNGDSNGSLDLTVGGGTAPYFYQWDNGAGNNQDPTGLGLNIYSVLVTDTNGCTTTASASITEPTALGASVNNTMLNCNGDSNGTLDLQVSGGTLPYSYQWDNGAGNNQDPTGLSANTYTVSITDGNNCLVITTAQVTEPSGMTATLLNSNPTECTACMGTADINVNGGLPPYSYLWSNGETTQDPVALCEGNNSVLITDGNGCTIPFNVNTTTLSTLSISGPTVLASPTCVGSCDASVTVGTNGGTAPFVFAWDAATANQNTATATNLCAGTYAVTVSDANGCVEIGTVTINDPIGVTATATVLQNVSCFNGSDGQAQVQAQGGMPPYTYAWSNGEATGTAIMLDQGLQEVTVTDVNGCISTAAVLVGQPSLVTAAIANVVPVNCVACDGAAEAIGNGGLAPYTYNWSNGSTVAIPTNLCTGSNNVTITDANGCSAVTAVGVPSASTLSITGVSPGVIACNGECTGSATLVQLGGEGPFTYAWNTIPPQNTPTATNLCAGTYSVTLTDANGCVEMSSITLTEPSLLGATLTGTNPACAGESSGTLTASPTGGSPPYDYTWSIPGNGPFLSNVPDGNHSVTVTDAQGCFLVENITLAAPNPLLLGVSGVTPATCFGEPDGTAQININGGTGPYEIVWDNTEITNPALYLYAGQHTATVTDDVGCASTISVQVVEPPELLLVDAGTSPVRCYGGNDGTAFVSVAGGTAPYSYAWSSGQVSSGIAVLTAGTYWVSIADANGCTLPPQNLVVTGPATPLDLQLTGNDPYCMDSADGSISASVTGGTPAYQYQWSTWSQGTSANGLSSGTYYLTVIDGNGCTISDSYFLNNPTEVVATLSSEDATCYGFHNGSISINTTTGGAGYYTYSIDGTNFQLDPNFYALTAGDYTIYIRDLENCEVTYDISVGQPDEIFVTATPTTSLIQLGDTLQLSSDIQGGGEFEYLWTYNPEGYITCVDCPNPIVSPLVNTQYMLEVTDTLSGCGANATVFVEVEKTRHVFIPNVFTPNGDDNNDIFLVFGGPMVSNIRLLRIFDRWGELVFEGYNLPPNDASFGWDGTYRGKKMNPGVFVYFAEIEFIDGYEDLYKGDVTIMK